MILNKKFIPNIPQQFAMSFGDPVRQTYYDSLPIQPYCADRKDSGVFQLRRDLAIQKPIIQHNPAYLTRMFVFDIDRPKTANIYWTVEQQIADSGAPPPNAISINPENGNGHIAYMLTTPVPMTDNSSQRAIKYAAAVEKRLALKLGADIAYTGFISKNILHEQWETEIHHPYSYDLQELEVWLSPELQKLTYPKNKCKLVGLGSRMRLFDDLRYWSYRHVQLARETQNFEQWFNRVLQQCEKFNTFDSRVAYCHVKSTAVSVAKWTWTKYTGRAQKNYGRDSVKILHLDLREKQTYAAIKTNEQRKRSSEQKIVDAILRLQKESLKISQSHVAKISGLGIATVKRHWSNPEIGIIRCTSDNPSS